MSPEKLRDILARHYDLASRAGRSQASSDRIDIQTQGGARWRLDRQHIDLYLPRAANRGPITFNWLTGVVSEYPAPWRPIVSPLATSSGVPCAEIVKIVAATMNLHSIEAEAVASYVLNHLLSRGMLVTVPEPIVSPNRFPGCAAAISRP